jgi:hypothetical protein
VLLIFFGFSRGTYSTCSRSLLRQVVFQITTNVIEGMLAGIGVIIILKKSHAFGYDANFEGDQSFIQSDGSNSFSSLFEVLIIFN